MTDAECVAFLQWALPKMGFRWAGYRKVRRQVCKRVARRLRGLAISNLTEYRAVLEASPEEWITLDSLCRITISRFWRDRGVFEDLERRVLPALARAAVARGDGILRCWSAGAASGEEPYSLSILWHARLAGRFPALRPAVVATDSEPAVLRRARTGVYGWGSLKDLPDDLRTAAFKPRRSSYQLKSRYRANVRFLKHDLRRRMPAGPFDLVLCRNLAFTYFAEAGQRRALDRIARRVLSDGVLVLGRHEHLPRDQNLFTPWNAASSVYRKAVK